jgi:hypothetical protein
MPRYIDVHRNLKGVKLSDVQAAHEKDLRVQNKYGVKFLKFWVDEDAGAVFCLSQAASKDSPARAHADAHGLLPDETYEVLEGS